MKNTFSDYIRLPEPLNLENSYKVILYFFLTRALWVKKKKEEGPRLKKKKKRSIDFKILVKVRSSLFNHSFCFTWVTLSQGWYNTFRTSYAMICFILGLGSIPLQSFSTRIHCLWSWNQIRSSSEGKKMNKKISDGQMDTRQNVNKKQNKQYSMNQWFFLLLLLLR